MTEQQQQGGDQGSQGGGGGGDFLASLPEDLRGLGTLKNFSGPDGHVKLAKSHDELVRKFSGRSMADLDPPKDEAARKTVLEKLGVKGPPDSPDAYDLPDSPTAKELRAWAHKHGLTVEQTKGLYAELEASLKSRSESFNKGKEEAAKKTEEALRSRWGDQFDANLALAREGIEKFFPEGFRKALEATGLHHDPAFMESATKLGKAFKEGTMFTGSGPGGGTLPQTVEQAQKARQEFFAKNQKLLLSQNDSLPDVRTAKEGWRRINQHTAQLEVQAQNSGQQGGAQ